MGEDYALQIDRLREKLAAMTYGKYSTFFICLLVKIGYLIPGGNGMYVVGRPIHGQRT